MTAGRALFLIALRRFCLYTNEFGVVGGWVFAALAMVLIATKVLCFGRRGRAAYSLATKGG
jgi:hypothetical protein